MKYLSKYLIIFFVLSFNKLSAHDNYYFGIGMCKEDGSNKIESNFKNFHSNKQKNNFSHQGYGLEIITGYGVLSENFYLGVEPFLSLKNIKEKSYYEFETFILNNNNSFITTIKKKESYGGCIRGGYKLINNNLLYSKIGLIISKLKINMNNRNDYYPEENLSKNFKKNIPGVIMGIGTEFLIDNNCLVRFEFCHNVYKKYNISKFAQTKSIQASVKPRSNEVKVALLIPFHR
jgi:hypothetical protein